MSNPYNLNDFQWKMFNLDAALTGNKRMSDIHNAVVNQSATIEDWIVKGHREWYLSDGGYSRIAVSDYDGHIWLTSNSLDKPKQAWGRCKELRDDVESLVRKALRR